MTARDPVTDERPTSRQAFSVAENWQDFIVPVVIVALVVIFTQMNPNYFSFGNFSNVLNRVALLAIVAIGASVVIFGGGFDLSAGSVVALAGVVGALLMGPFGIAVGIIGAVAVGILVGAFNGAIVGYFGVSPLIVTLGTLHAARGAALILSGGAAIYNLPTEWTRFGTTSYLGLPVMAWVAAFIFLVFFAVIRYTPYGMRLYAVGGNPAAARLSGISVPRIKVINFAIAGGLSGLAGILLTARTAGGEPTAGGFYELEAIAAVILGGAALSGGEGKLWRSMMGIFLLGLIDNGLNVVGIHPHWKGVAIGLILIVAASLDAVKKRR